jgi:hypothetical protein
MVSTQDESTEALEQLEWRLNVPFESIPRELVEQLAERPYSYDEYLSKCEMLDKLPSFWNLVLVYHDEFALVAWGHVEPLEGYLYVSRISIPRELFTFSNSELLEAFVDMTKEIARELGLRRVVFVSDRWQAWLRKLPGVIRVTDARVMEVY